MSPIRPAALPDEQRTRAGYFENLSRMGDIIAQDATGRATNTRPLYSVFIWFFGVIQSPFAVQVSGFFIAEKNI